MKKHVTHRSKLCTLRSEGKVHYFQETGPSCARQEIVTFKGVIIPPLACVVSPRLVSVFLLLLVYPVPVLLLVYAVPLPQQLLLAAVVPNQ